jgi:hypothetical protein
VPWLRPLVTRLSPRKPGFDLGSVHMGFVVDKVALGQVFLRVLRFSPVSIIPLVLHYNGKAEKIIIFIIFTGLYKKPLSLWGPSINKKNYDTVKIQKESYKRKVGLSINITAPQRSVTHWNPNLGQPCLMCFERSVLKQGAVHASHDNKISRNCGNINVYSLRNKRALV